MRGVAGPPRERHRRGTGCRSDPSRLHLAIESLPPTLDPLAPGVTDPPRRPSSNASAGIDRALADRFHADAAKGVVGHPFAALVLAFLVRNDVDATLALGLVVVICVAALVRIRIHRGAIGLQHPHAVVVRVRWSTAIMAAAWAGATLVLVPVVSPAVEGRILMVVAGLVSAGVVTHEADPRSFDLFTGLLLGSALIGLLLGGVGATVGVDLLFVIAFWAMMTVLQRYLYRELHDRMTTVEALEDTSAKAAAAETAYGDLVESASDLIWRIDASGNWTFVNDAARDIYGLAPDRLVGTSALARSDPERSGSDEGAFERLLGGEEIQNHETVHRTVDEESRHLSFSGRPILDEDGAVLGAQGTARDVTDQARARRAIRALAEQTVLVRSVINATDDLIFYKDASGTLTGCNDAFAQFIGRSEEEIVGRTDHDIHPRDRADTLTGLHRRVMNTDRAVHFEEWVESDGNSRLLNFVITSITGPDGGPVGTLGVARDMTEWRETEEKLLALAQEAERANRMKTEFLANMSHEIRTPMNGILGMTELVLESDLTAEQREYLRVAAASAHDLLRIVDDILDLSKIDAGQVEIQHIEFDMTEVLAQSTRVLAAQATARGNTLALDVDRDVSRWFSGDPLRLRQVLTNLVSNAVKFTKNGDIVIAARRVDPVDGQDEDAVRVRIEVVDEGIGIWPNELDHIFEEFRQADSSVSRKYGGTGLGLTICRRLIDLMGGTMGVDSERGHGSTFWFEVPLAPSDEAHSDTGGADPADFRERRILVVSENRSTRRILASVYDAVGADVTAVESGSEGLLALERARASGSPIELVVTYSRMSGMSGADLIEQVRAGDDRDVPILVISSTQGDLQAKARIRELGVLGILLNPVPGRELLDRSASAFDPAEPTPDTPAQSTAEPVPRPEGTVRLLLAEDVAVNRQVALAILNRLGYEVEWVENGRAAVDAARRGNFDAILMDVQMPVMDGLEATRKLRRDAETRNTPIIAVTAHALGTGREKCLEAGMNDFISKPFRARTLAGTIERWTGTRPATAKDDASSRAPHDASGETPVDLEALQASMEASGIPDAVPGLIQVFRDDLPRRRSAIEEALQSEAKADIATTAHALKSAAGSVRADPLHRALRALEVGARAGEPVEELGEAVLRRIDDVEAFLADRDES